MTNKELVAFIERIRNMCGNDKTRMQYALITLHGILERQHTNSAKMELVGNLLDIYVIKIMANESTRISKMADLQDAIEKGRRQREADEAHRGCR